MGTIACSLLAGGSRALTPFQDSSPYPGSPGPGTYTESQGPSTYTLFAAEQLAYDDNLYRLPATADLSELVGAGASRQAIIDTLSLGTDVHWYDGNQAVNLHARADDNRFFDNESLSNFSEQGDLTWDWRLGERLSGQAGVQYFRALTSFASTNYYARDMVGRVDYFAEGRYRVGPQVTLFGGFDGADTSLSALPERIYDFRSEAGNGGVEYASASGNTVSIEYRYADARFPTLFVLNGAPFNSDYDEDTALVTVRYALSAATRFEASAGYLRRGYPYSEFAAFSGGVGRASLEWQPTDALQVVLTGRHELRAYVDSESDYFVANGGSIEPEWKATPALTLSLALSYENHAYIGSSPSALTFTSRHDIVTTQQARLTYSPMPFLIATLTYQHSRRDSNREALAFDDGVATANVTFKCQL
jgi:putative beta-barrel porin BBP2